LLDRQSRKKESVIDKLEQTITPFIMPLQIRPIIIIINMVALSLDLGTSGKIHNNSTEIGLDLCLKTVPKAKG